ncbi:lipocalin family protein [Flavobacterium wongokense]|uniref:lipocalin family protein n=1 Tax=Flavobacterium wongokense TaxID=2910674 RepID=UPI001F3D6437|nr:lipocalin family protein [Flavobacterium sp. WG47]MCF6131558.1 lipocalin family protein [Flavobacterium sp. WG47]
MKKIKFIAMALVAGMIFSCSSSDGADTSGELNGKWYNKETIVFGQTYPYDDHESCGKDYLQFNPDGTGAFVDIYQCDPYSDPFTYTRSGDNVTVLFGGEDAETAKIIELSSTTLKVKVIYDYDEDGDNDTVIEVYTRT